MYGLSDCKIQQIEGGVTNVTYLVTASDGRQYIAQRLNPIFTAQTVNDYVNVSRELMGMGWDLQQIVPTLTEQTCVVNQNELWRLATYIPSDPTPKHRSVDTLYDVGSLLAKLHKSLALCSYIPKYTIPHCHDTDYFIHTLEGVVEQLSGEHQGLARKVLDAYPTLDPRPNTSTQLIHGDPRTTNILYRNSIPYTYIDFDMLMVSTIWVDLGDLLRAVSGDDTQSIAQFDPTYVNAVIAGYAESLGPSELPNDFHRFSMNAMRTICLELASRFLIDIVHDDHFGWDNSLYVNRGEHNFARAKAQYEIYTSTTSKN
jgi:Ser/Thr protein kinase RdoA (MazF antagonist)